MDVGSFSKRLDREGMPIRAYKDVFTASFELNSILCFALTSTLISKLTPAELKIRRGFFIVVYPTRVTHAQSIRLEYAK